jgi:uncharacterized protein YfaS (alpha-2-macroglobulin family)
VFASGGPIEVRTTGPAAAAAYVSFLQTGVPTGPPPVAEHGFKLRRRYLDRHDVAIPDGGVQSGDVVTVELTIEPAGAMANVVIEDLLPAGLEIENSRLVTQAPGAANDDPNAKQDPSRFEPRRVDMRDDRLILIGDFANGGAKTYVYTARAVAPGIFVVPPVRAECMYDIGTSGLAAGGGILRVNRIDRAPVADVGHE